MSRHHDNIMSQQYLNKSGVIQNILTNTTLPASTMTIETHFELTECLITNYVGSLYPLCPAFEQKLEVRHDKMIQYDYVNNDVTILTTNITQVSQEIILLNLIYTLDSAKKVDSVLIDWSSHDIVDHDIEFPINKINLSSKLIQSFNRKIKLCLSINLETLFQSPSVSQEHEPREHRKVPNPLENDADRLPPSGVLEKSKPSVTMPSSRPNDMPDFDDELEIRAPARGPPPSAFPSIGDQDLFPSGVSKYPLLKPHLDYGPPGDGGMYPSPNHPIFGGPSGGNTSRKEVPPGARFDDPYGEDNLDALGQGLPGNLRGGGQGFLGPGFRGSGGFSGGNGPFHF